MEATPPPAMPSHDHDPLHPPQGPMDPPPQSQEHLQSLDLIHDLQQRLNQLRSWEQGHGQLVHQIHQQIEFIAQQEAAIRDRSSGLDKLIAELEQREAQIESKYQAVVEHQQRFDQQQRELDQRQLEIDQQREAIDTLRQQIDQDRESLSIEQQRHTQALKDLDNERRASAQRQMQIKEDLERIDKQQRELAGLPKQREELQAVRRYLKTSEEKMVNRWSTGGVAEVVTRFVLAVGAVVGLSLAVGHFLLPYYQPHALTMIPDPKLELMAMTFGGLTLITLAVGFSARGQLLRHPRVMDEPNPVETDQE